MTVQVFLVVWLLATPGLPTPSYPSSAPDMEITLTRGSLADCERVADKLSRRVNVVAWCVDDYPED